MWTNLKKWRSDSLEARIHRAALERALAIDGLQGEEAEAAALDAVFRVMSWLYSSNYTKVAERIADEFDIETSETALNRFWSRFASTWFTERMRRSSTQAREFAGVLDRQQVTEGVIDQVTQAAFEIMTSPQVDPDALLKLGKLVATIQKDQRDDDRKRQQLALDTRRIAMLEEEKAAAKALIAQTVTAAKAGGLTEETLRLIEEQAALL